MLHKTNVKSLDMVIIKRKYAFRLKIKFVLLVKVIDSKHFEQEAFCQLPVLLFVTYKFIPNILSTFLNNIIIPVKGIQK